MGAADKGNTSNGSKRIFMNRRGVRYNGFRLPLTFLLLLTLISAGCSFLAWSSNEILESTRTLSTLREPLEAFQLLHPYDYDGTWYKVQLHMHTQRSIDSQWPREDALRAYENAGYDAVAITDHDRYDRGGAPNTSQLVVIPAMEFTLTDNWIPIGQHAVFLFASPRAGARSASDTFSQVQSDGGLISIAHPSWDGMAGNGRWHLWQLLAAPNFTLFEVYNPHSTSVDDTAMWHTLLLERGPTQPVWAIAVDDAHAPTQVNRGWTMVKAESKSLTALRDALARGSLYATTGPELTFSVVDSTIHVTIDRSADVFFIDGRGKKVHVQERVTEAEYTPRGTEGLVRVEVYSTTDESRAWSQPFWLIGVE